MIRIIIPAYNEEKNIQNCIRTISKHLSSFSHWFYVINDGSLDRTRDLVKNMQKKYNIILINHSTNKGIAEVFKTGLSAVTKQSSDSDIIFIMEADNTSDPSLLPLMIKKIKSGNDIVIASRYREGGGYQQFPVKRLLLSKSANTLLRILYHHKKVKDYTIFYRGYKASIMKRAMRMHKSSFITTRYFVANTEILIKLLKLTRDVEEIPFVYDYSKKKGRSGLRIKRNILQYARFIFRSKVGVSRHTYA